MQVASTGSPVLASVGIDHHVRHAVLHRLAVGNPHPASVLAFAQHTDHHLALVRVVGFAADSGRDEPCHEDSASVQAVPMWSDGKYSWLPDHSCI